MWHHYLFLGSYFMNYKYSCTQAAVFMLHECPTSEVHH
uniref:Uncharacterized protein n=1 Tax=Anguilla anguilla TaxID=7936 RepID=A0A0E9SLB5_ANGAN